MDMAQRAGAQAQRAHGGDGVLKPRELQGVACHIIEAQPLTTGRPIQSVDVTEWSGKFSLERRRSSWRRGCLGGETRKYTFDPEKKVDVDEETHEDLTIVRPRWRTTVAPQGAQEAWVGIAELAADGSPPRGMAQGR